MNAKSCQTSAIKSDAKPREGKTQDAANVGSRSPSSNVCHAAAQFRRPGGDDRVALIYSDRDYYIHFHKPNGSARSRHHKRETLCTFSLGKAEPPPPFPLNPGDKATVLQLTGSVNNMQVGAVIPASCVIVR